MNYQIEPCHINKITIYENVNYSPPPYLILKTSKQTLCLFRWKTFYKDSFLHFPMFSGIKKNFGQWKTIFSQWKTFIKIRLIFYKLFSKKKFLENNLFFTFFGFFKLRNIRTVCFIGKPSIKIVFLIFQCLVV